MSQENKHDIAVEYEPSSETHVSVRKIRKADGATAATLLLGAGAGIAADRLAENPVEYSGTQEVVADIGTNPTEMVRENVAYDSNEVPTPEIVNYVVDMPENQETMKDGLGAGESLTMPVKAERED